MTKTIDKINEYLNERKPTSHDYEIKDTAVALTGEIESFIEGLIEDWINKAQLFFDDDEEFDKNDIMKMINLAIKKINIKKLDI